ncbi:MAG: NUDIX hydrolase [Phycisphaerae bacterium]|nr:NUDIX hydrolase [Phycisphaerae bacterium]
MEPKWLDWAKRLQAISQNGLTYAKDHFDQERFRQVEDIAAEILADKAGVEPEAVLDLFSRQTDYATPKVDVRGVVFRDDTILLVKETSDHKWSVPGGWADIGESPSESVVREVWEESGFRVRAEKLLAVYDRSKHPHRPLVQYHIYKMFFLCEIIGGQPALSNETEEVAFFRENEIPELSITKILPEQIARMFEYYRRESLPVDFD